MGKRKSLMSLFRRSSGKDEEKTEAKLQSTAKNIVAPVSNDGQKPASSDEATLVSTPGEIPEDTPTETTALPLEPLPESPSAESISKTLWEQAYERLMGEEEGLVVVYEKVLSQQLVSSEGEEEVEITAETRNIFADQEFDAKLKHMEQVTQLSLERASRHSKIQKGAGEALKIFETIKPLVGTAMGADPVASMAWGGICATLPMIIRPLVAGKTMADGLGYVIQRMNMYLDFVHVLLQKRDEPSTSQQQDRLRAALTSKIGNLYTTILRYEMQCVCYCYDMHPAVKALRAMIALDDFEARLTALKAIESDVQRDIEYFAISYSIEVPSMLKSASVQLGDMSQQLVALADAQDRIRQDMEMARKEEQRKVYSEEIGKFKITDYEEVRHWIVERVPGTCEWVGNHEKVQEWLSMPASLLLISAGPGCGKSTLAKYLIEEVLPELCVDATVAYFFFRENEGHRSVTAALSSLLHQVFYQNSEVISLIHNEIKENLPSGSHMWNLSGLWKILTKLCQLSQRPRIIFILDALDECNHKELRSLSNQLLEITSHLYEEGHPKVSFLATTRGYPEITELFEDNCIHLSADSTAESDHIQHDINLVLDHKVETMRNGTLSEDRKQMIKGALLEKSSGQRTYLWLDLVFQVLDRNFNNKASVWERLIQNPPKTIDKAYDGLLRNVEDKTRVRLLLDLVIAAERPLSLRELNVALEMHATNGEVLESDLDLESDEDFKKWIIQECGFFLRIYADRVYLIHQTAKDFLVANPSSPSSTELQGTWHHSTSSARAHRAMARCCLAYLLSMEKAGLKEEYGRFKESESWLVDHVFAIHVPSGPFIIQTDSTECEDEFLFDGSGECGPFKIHMDTAEWLEIYARKFSFLPYPLKFWRRHCDLAQQKHQEKVLARDLDQDLFPMYHSMFKGNFWSHDCPLWYQWSTSRVRTSDHTYETQAFESGWLYECPDDWEQTAAAALFAISFDHFEMLLEALQGKHHGGLRCEGHHDRLVGYAARTNAASCYEVLFALKSENKLGTSYETFFHELASRGLTHLLEPLCEHCLRHDSLYTFMTDPYWAAHVASAAQKEDCPLVELLFRFARPGIIMGEYLKKPLLGAVKDANLDMINLLLGNGAVSDLSELSKSMSEAKLPQTPIESAELSHLDGTNASIGQHEGKEPGTPAGSDNPRGLDDTDAPADQDESDDSAKSTTSTTSSRYSVDPFDHLSWADQGLLLNRLLDIGLASDAKTLSRMEEYINRFYLEFDEREEEDAPCPVQCKKTITRWLTQLISLGSIHELEHRRLVELAALCPAETITGLDKTEEDIAAITGVDIFHNAYFLSAYESSLFKKLADANVDLTYEWTALALPVEVKIFWNFAFFIKAGGVVTDLSVLMAILSPSDIPVALLSSVNNIHKFVADFRFSEECTRSLFEYGQWRWGPWQRQTGKWTYERCVEGDSLLHISCRLKPTATVKSLMELGARLDVQNTHGAFPLHDALSSVEKVRLLCEHGADPNCRDNNGSVPLHLRYFEEGSFAVGSEESLLVTQELIERKADVEARASEDITPLKVMCWYHAPKQLKLVLDELEKIKGALDGPRSGFLPNACSFTNTRHEPWPDSSEVKDLAYNYLATLCDCGFDVNAQDSDGLSGLHHVCKGMGLNLNAELCLQAVEQLLSFDADGNIKDSFGRTPLHILADIESGHGIPIKKEATKLLTTAGAEINTADNKGQTPLHILAESILASDADEAPEMLERFIELGAELNSLNHLGRTALHILANMEASGRYAIRQEAAKMLAVSGADINSTDKIGQTPLHVLAKSVFSSYADGYCEGAPEMLKVFIEQGAEVDSLDHSRSSPLHILADMTPGIFLREEAIKLTIKLLTAAGADINKTDSKGQTPLHILAGSVDSSYAEETAEIFELFMELGAETNRLDLSGRTPLQAFHENIPPRDNVESAVKEINILLEKNGDHMCGCDHCVSQKMHC